MLVALFFFEGVQLKMVFRKGILPGEATSSGSLRPMLVALVVVVGLIAGCASVKNKTTVKRDPGEVYDGAMTAYMSHKYEDAVEGFSLLMKDYPLTPFAIEAQLMLGDVSFDEEKFAEAGSYYTNFVALYPTHKRASYALFQKGMTYFKDALSYDRDQTSTRKALFAFEDVIEAYPESMYSEKADEIIIFLKRRLAKGELAIARFYFKDKNYEGALSRFRDILKEYPESGLIDETLYYIGVSYQELGEEKLSREAFMTLIADFPDSPFVKSARSRLDES